MRQHRRLVAIIGMIVASGVATAAHAQDANDNVPIPETPRQSLTAIERSFAVAPDGGPADDVPADP